MTELKIKIEDQYLAAFLNFLETLNYVEVDQSATKRSESARQSATEKFLQTAEPEHPLRKGVRPVRKGATIEDLIRESGYKKTDWKKVASHADNMNIMESTEELLAQLTSGN